jgi:energy-coupling factor transport system substrate-specific component
MLGALLVLSDLVMDVLPNIHFVGLLSVLYTVVYRAKALVPIYVYVFITGFYSGFATWWVPYLYVWAVLWGMAMLIPSKIPPTAKKIVYPAVCALHGFAFGIIYAPGQALLFGYNLEQTIAWIMAGTGFDITHGISNFCAGLLVYPLSQTLIKLEKKSQYPIIKH